MAKILTLALLLFLAGCATQLRPGQQRYADTQLELALMRILFDRCVKDPKVNKADCDQLDSGDFKTENGLLYQRYINMQVERGRRGEIGKDEVIYTIAEKGRQLREANDQAWAKWQRENPSLVEKLGQIRAGSPLPMVNAPLPPRPLNCTSIALGGGMTTTNCN
jgi:hypothetical protein